MPVTVLAAFFRGLSPQLHTLTLRLCQYMSEHRNGNGMIIPLLEHTPNFATLDISGFLVTDPEFSACLICEESEDLILPWLQTLSIELDCSHKASRLKSPPSVEIRRHMMYTRCRNKLRQSCFHHSCSKMRPYPGDMKTIVFILIYLDS